MQKITTYSIGQALEYEAARRRGFISMEAVPHGTDPFILWLMYNHSEIRRIIMRIAEPEKYAELQARILKDKILNEELKGMERSMQEIERIKNAVAAWSTCFSSKNAKFSHTGWVRDSTMHIEGWNKVHNLAKNIVKDFKNTSDRQIATTLYALENITPPPRREDCGEIQMGLDILFSDIDASAYQIKKRLFLV